MAEALARGEQRLHLGQPALKVNVGVGADMRRALTDAAVHQVPRALRGAQRQRRPHLLVVLDAAHPRADAAVRPPGQPDQRLVEVHVPIDEPGQDQLPAHLHHRARLLDRAIGHPDLGNLPVGNADVRLAPVREQSVREERIRGHGSAPLVFALEAQKP